MYSNEPVATEVFLKQSIDAVLQDKDAVVELGPQVQGTVVQTGIQRDERRRGALLFVL
jgi:hypothetical protein